MNDETGLVPEPSETEALEGAIPEEPLVAAERTEPAAPEAIPSAFEEAPAARKHRRWPWLVLAAVLAGALAVGGFLAYEAGEKAKAEANVEQAEAHYQAAQDALAGLSKISDEMTKPGADYVGLFEEMQTELEVALRMARRELEASEQDIAWLDESTGRSDYIKSIAAARNGLDSFKGMIDHGAEMVAFGKAEQQWSEVTSAGDALRSAADAAAMKDQWSAAYSKARMAMHNYSEAKAIAIRLNSEYPGYGADHLVAASNLAVLEAREVANYCAAAKTNSVSRANKAVDAVEAYQKRMSAVDTPDYLADPSILYGPMLEDLKAMGDQLEKSDTLHERAIKALERLKTEIRVRRSAPPGRPA